MEKLFSSAKIGSLRLKNRLVRSATAENMADIDGILQTKMFDLYQHLVDGGVGLIITGHMNVHPSGRANSEMAGIYSDAHIEGLSRLTQVVHSGGGKVAVQINHTGLQAKGGGLEETMAPSNWAPDFIKTLPRQMSEADIYEMIDCFGQAAARARAAGFDAVQVHGAHGYLVNQFLSPLSNHREDQWGGSLENRMRFLREVSSKVLAELSPEMPMLIKLGIQDGLEGGLTLEEGLRVVEELADMGYQGVELSTGFSGKLMMAVKKGIRNAEEEAYLLHFAQAARGHTKLPLMAVGGFRSLAVMEQALQAGAADFISLCRPLINDPALPNKMKDHQLNHSACLSANNCWAKELGEGIACKCPTDKVTAVHN